MSTRPACALPAQGALSKLQQPSSAVEDYVAKIQFLQEVWLSVKVKTCPVSLL